MKIDSVEALIAMLEGYVRSIAYRQVAHNRLSVLLESDDIINELMLELVLCWKHYSDKDDDSLLKLAKTMVRNRMGELIHRHHVTHRGIGNNNVTLDSEWVGTHKSSSNIPALIESQESLRNFMSTLTKEETKIVEALTDLNDPRMIMWVKVYAMRRSATYDNPTIKITHYMVADALHMDKDRVKELYKSIQEKWREND